LFPAVVFHVANFRRNPDGIPSGANMVPLQFRFKVINEGCVLPLARFCLRIARINDFLGDDKVGQAI
jgi:hypothetical protein